MSHKKGAYLGGIRTVEDLRARCRINDETGCWHWSMHCDGSAARVHFIAPDTGEHLIARGPRAALYLSKRKNLPKGHVAFRINSCNSYDCVNPEHMKSGDHSTYGKNVSEKGSLKGIAKRISANRENARNRAKINLDQAREIRKSEGTSLELSEKYGIAQSGISSIKRGESWKELIQNSSVFTWRPK